MSTKHIPMELMHEAARELSAEQGVLWNADLAVTALVKLARDPGLNEAEQADMRHEILLVLGAIDGYTDSTGTVRVTPQEKRRMDKAAGLI
ncbi:hypothetical protein [Paraburkholderia strydomiana]|uniref:hypothetical protein n=1 Tax=Paraburkholderia strydomiana TaxID=1245417 RepID=UPI0038B7E79E